MIEKPLKANCFPLLFVPMDSPQMFEDSLELICPDLVTYWGQDVVNFNPMSRDKVINSITQSTVGDSVQFIPKENTYQYREYFNKPKESKSVHYVATTPKQGMFEIRIYNKYGRMNSKKAIEELREKILTKFH